MKIKDLKNKKIVILGVGREGLDAFLFLRKFIPKKNIFIADQKDFDELEDKAKRLIKRSNLLLGDDYLKKIRSFDYIVKSPGINYRKLKLPVKKILSPTQLFFDNAESKIIGITGTKGKSTTSALVAKVLKDNGFRVELVGNIEVPALSFLSKKPDFFVFELSSHQLQLMDKSPWIAVFLNIYEEHLDYYSSMKEYFRAKANITKFQNRNDYFIYNPRIRIKAKAKKILIKNYENIFSSNPWLLKITHRDNLIAVFEIAKILRIDLKNVLKSIKKFKTLEHRLEYIGQHKGIKFYDDSIATIPEATIFALETLGKDVETLIAGGYDRGIDYSKLSKYLCKNSVKNLILFSGSGQRILKGMKCKKDYYFIADMQEAVKLCYKLTKKGKICLLSCASPSFGLFKDFKERGDLFKKYVNKLK